MKDENESEKEFKKKGKRTPQKTTENNKKDDQKVVFVVCIRENRRAGASHRPTLRLREFQAKKSFTVQPSVSARMGRKVMSG